MKIVVLDAGTLDFERPAWDAFAKAGELTLHEHTPYQGEEIIARCKEAEVVLTNKVPLSAETINALPRLRYIGVLATGYNIIDLSAAKKAGVTVCNVPGYSTASVVQHTLALMLEATNRVGDHSVSVHGGDWVRSTHFSYWQQAPVEFSELTVGIVGYGSIGKPVAELAHTLGAKVLASARSEKPHPGWERFSFSSTEAIFKKADLISLHCPQTPENTGFINDDLIKEMKPGAIIVNTARGGLINESDVAEALKSGRLGAYAADVVSAEPMKADNPLLSAKNCILTPHLAWASQPARERLLRLSVDNLKAFLADSPQNVVGQVVGVIQDSCTKNPHR